MELRQLRYFVAVYEEGGFTPAARREHCTQPGISVQIQRLESELGVRLFTRAARGVIATVAGKRLYESSSSILAAVALAKEEMLGLAGSITGVLRLGIIPTFAKSLLPAVLRRYTEAHPNVELQISEANSATLRDWLAAGEIEFALMTEPPLPTELVVTPFCRSPLALVGAAVTLGTGRGRGKGPDLRNLKLVLPSSRRTFRQTVVHNLNFFRSIKVARILEIDGQMTAMEFVSRSEWFTIIPSIFVVSDVREGRLSAWPIPGFDLSVDFVVARSRQCSLTVAATKFIELLKEELSTIAVKWKETEAMRAPVVAT